MTQTNVRRLRIEASFHAGRPLTLRVVAEATGLERTRLNKIELGTAKIIKADELIRLRKFYTEKIGREVQDEEILGDYARETEDEDKQQETPELAAA